MPSEGAPQQYQTLESLKRSFKQRLDKILNKELTVENIEVFADEALDETITLTDDVLKEYRNNLNVFPNVIPLDKQEQENEAFEKLDLPNIQEILQSVIEVKNEVESIKTYLNSNTEKTNVVNTPPQEGQAPIVGSGEGGFENKETFPRLLTLMYILKHDFDIEPTDIPKPQEGKVTRDMVRKTPYVRVDIPQLERAVYICEEEENASYVFDTEKIKEAGLNIEEIDLDDKGNKNSLIANHAGIGLRIIQSKNWRNKIRNALEEEMPSSMQEIKAKQEREERKAVSEFKERVNWLFEVLQADVISKGVQSTSEYVKAASKNKWPNMNTLTSRSEFPKKADGTNDWDKFFGRKTFENLHTEILAKGVKSSTDYRKQRVENKWPDMNTLTSRPEFPKKADGTNDWDKFFGRESRPVWTFQTLQTDVIAKGIKSSSEYVKNAPKNRWPEFSILSSMPEFPKREDGSNDWGKFFGMESKPIKPVWKFETLQTDVIAKGIKSFSDYKKKCKQNKWPSKDSVVSMPEFPKKADGSNDWDTFLGRESRPARTFKTLQTDVIAKMIQSSEDYRKKYKQNKWPSNITLVSMPEFPKREDGSNDWNKFLGRESKPVWTFQTLQKDVIAKGVQSSYDYSKKYKQNKWPKNDTLVSKPEFPKKADGSNDWDTFLGRESRPVWTIETIQTDVRAKEIKTSFDYGKSASKHKWPSDRTLTSMPGFPKKADGSNDWGAFLGRE